MPLFNGENLDGWYTFRQTDGKNNDTLHIFKPENGMIHVLDVDPTKFDVGTPLRMVFRIKEKDSMRHYNRYFWKAAPLALAALHRS